METNLKDIKEYEISSFEDYRGEIFTTYNESVEGRKFEHDKICVLKNISHLLGAYDSQVYPCSIDTTINFSVETAINKITICFVTLES